MISRTEELFAVEGPTLVGHETVPMRIEINPSTGLIQSIGKPRGTATLRLGSEHLILPGCIDFHVHAREDVSGEQNYKETFRSAGEAAIHGGVVAFVDMPNNKIPPIDDESYKRKREIARATPVDVLLYAGIGPGTRPLSFSVPYKAYMGPSVGELFFEDDQALRAALAHYRGQWVSFHAEDPEILRENRNARDHYRRRPPEAEIRAVEVALALSGEFGIHAHICHLSTEGGMRAIAKARERGTSVSCEVTPHHLAIDLESLDKQPRPGFLQCNPPIRPRSDRTYLLQAFREGAIDFLATDHAPHSFEENESGISGVPHLDTFGPFLFLIREQGVSWRTLVKAACEAPGGALSRFLPNRYGRPSAGFVGSLTILDTSTPMTVRRSALKTASAWSPFEGSTYSGRVSHTIVRGKVYAAPPEG